MRVVNVDNAAPGPLEIACRTHQRPSGGSSDSRYAAFELMPKGLGRSGLSAIEYRLYSGDAEIVSGQVNATRRSDISLLEFEDLTDNLPGESYTLCVWPRSGSGILGAVATYDFRIDSSEQAAFSISLNPMADGTRWYTEVYSRVSWNKPTGISEVREYGYLISPTDVQLPSTPEAAASYDVSAWTKTSDTGATCNFFDPLGDKMAATLYVLAYAEAWDGSRLFAKRPVKIDVGTPYFGKIAGTSKRIDYEILPGSRSAIVKWGNISEASGQSGVSRVSIRVFD